MEQRLHRPIEPLVAVGHVHAHRGVRRNSIRLLERRQGLGEALAGVVLDAALEGVSIAFYLIHSMASRGDFEKEDRRAAEAFAAAARKAGVRRIIYLGGLGEEEALSSHLASRHEVGRILRESGVPTLEFRASIIIGSGSLSFEMIRALVGKLPIMITPKWVDSPAQPIAIEDVVAYLMAALDYEGAGSEVFEIGGADQASYRDIMAEYARQTGLRRRFVAVPVLTPWLSSLWLGLVTPVYARVGRKLIDSLRNATVVRDDRARAADPDGAARDPAQAAAEEREARRGSDGATGQCSSMAVHRAAPGPSPARIRPARRWRSAPS